MTLPFDGAISRFHDGEAPEHIRAVIDEARRTDIIGEAYPYDRRMDKGEYKGTLEALQVELVKMQRWMEESGARIVLLFEGRDAAGKGGAISRLTMNLNPRVAKVVALGKPTERERGQWYFQRYVAHLPTTGEMTVFDRSWYNRGVVEKVFGFATDDERERFFEQAPRFEEMLIRDGTILMKFWLNVSRAEQLRRFMKRETDPLKQWKLSGIDVKGLPLWQDYTDAIRETLDRTHTDAAPWTVVRSDDKRRARIAVLRSILSRIDYAGRDDASVIPPDPAICGGPEIWVDGDGVEGSPAGDASPA